MASSIVYQRIRDELDADPLSRGYSGMTDVQATESLNTVNRSRNKVSMPGDEIGDSIDEAEWNALSGEGRAEVGRLMGVLRVDPFGYGASVLKKAFPGGAQTLTNLAVARVESISRGIEIEAGTVKVGDVGYARGLA